MKIHEYQAKSLFAAYGIPTRKGHVAFTLDEALAGAAQQPGPIWVVKAQIHAGGRGKGGGVKVCKSLDEVKEKASAILGMQLKTPQTGPEGQLVRRIYIENGVDIAHEYYVAMLLDRDSGRVVLMASAEGGMDIEEVAEHSPEKIIKVLIDPKVGLQAFQSRQIGFFLGFDAKQTNQFAKLMAGLYQLYLEKDCTLVEVNPLVTTPAGELYALDGKVNFDDNAMYRHPDIQAMRDLDEEDAREIEASKFDLNYVHLDGTVGCLVNGAGLAMATMDILKYFGAEPANFLDVGGGATAEKVTAAFKIILSDRRVQGIFVNIFGGIMKCDTIASGVITAAREVTLDRPLVVRLEGTNVELGKQMLAESGLPIITASDMKDGAQKAAAAAKRFAETGAVI
jgi:succinyl-CoA synthetase beta subunit